MAQVILIWIFNLCILCLNTPNEAKAVCVHCVNCFCGLLVYFYVIPQLLPKHAIVCSKSLTGVIYLLRGNSRGIFWKPLPCDSCINSSKSGYKSYGQT